MERTFLNYRAFGYIPKVNFSFEKRPNSANATLLANWYNSIVPILNEEEERYVCTDRLRRTWVTEDWYNKSDGKRVYHEVTPTFIKSIKTGKNDFVYSLNKFEAELKDYEIEKELQKPEYDKLRSVIDYLKGIETAIRDTKSYNKDYSISIEKNECLKFENIVKAVKEGKSLNINGSELFGSCGYRSWKPEPEGVHTWWFSIRYKDGKFVFPINTDPYCWDGHMYINSGWSNKRKTELGMSGGAVRIKKYAKTVEKYLNAKKDIVPVLLEYYSKCK